MKLKNSLANEFEIKDLGNLKYFLGIDVVRSKHSIYFFQSIYILDLLKETRMLGCKAFDNPMEVILGWVKVVRVLWWTKVYISGWLAG
jgi:hypothetical protein